MVRLIERHKSFYMTDMEDGDIAVITSDDYNGHIVQRFGDTIFTIGRKYGNHWTIREGVEIKNEVALLKDGDTLMITKD